MARTPLLRLFQVGLASLLVCLPLPVAAQVPWVPAMHFNNAGGLNDAYDPTAIADNQAADLQNVVFTTGGAISKRSGFSRINSTAISATAVFTGGIFYRQANGNRFLVATVSDGVTDRLYAMDYGAGTTGPDGTWDNITGSLSLTFGSDDQADFAIAQDQVVIEDGVNTTPPYVWTGTGNATALGGSPDSARFVELHKNHLFKAGDSAEPSTLDFSGNGNIASWTSTDEINVETNDGQIITGLRSGLDALYVWKQESIFRVSGTNRDDWVLEQMVKGIGTCSNASITEINNRFIFLTCTGDVAIYDGGVNVQIISSLIEGTLTAMNQDRFDQAVATAFDDGTGDQDYYVSLSASGASTHNRILLFDTHHRAWTKFTGMAANAMWTYELGTLQRALVFGDYAGRANRYPNTNADAGASIAAYYVTKQFSYPDMPQDKTWRLLEVFVNQQGNYNLTAYTRADFESPGTAETISLAGTGSLWNTAVWDTDSYADLTTVIARIEVKKRRRFFQIRFENNQASEPFTIRGWINWLEPEGRV